METPFDPAFIRLLLDSHARLLGTPPIAAHRSLDEATHWLYEEAPFCLVAHTADADPHFCYANKAAQQCFGYSWDEFVCLPSRLSAEAPNRQERQLLLEDVSQNGFATGYRGLRIAQNGKRFWIEGVKVWNLIDESGQNHGQAATYLNWTSAA